MVILVGNWHSLKKASDQIDRERGGASSPLVNLPLSWRRSSPFVVLCRQEFVVLCKPQYRHSGTVDGQNGWLWTGVTLVACSMRWLERPPGPAVARWVLGCDGQRFRWPETLQPSSTRPRQRPREPLQYPQFVFARHSTRRGLPNQGFHPSSLVLVRTAKPRLPHQFAFLIIPSPTPTTLHVFNLLWA